MALTRKFLKEMGIESEKIDLIIDAHAEAVDGLKAERDEWKDKAGESEQLKAEVEELKKQTTSESEWKEKFEKEHSDFEAFKTAQNEKEVNEEKTNAYKGLLKELKISDNVIDSILKVTDVKALELEDGKLKDIEKLTESVKTDYAGFIPTEKTEGASVPKPPKTDEGKTDLDSLTMAEYISARKQMK